MKGVALMLAMILFLGFGTALGQIQTAQSGPWQDPNTWQGGIIPTSADDVFINAGHTVSVDDGLSECHSVSFGGNDALIDMNSNSRLSVYGNFTLFSTSHNVFSAGWSGTNAYVWFTGDEPVQTISGWNTSGGSTSFRDLVIDKPVGTQVKTDKSGMKFCVQNSFEIVSGTFLFDEGDDLEARWASSGAFTNNQNLVTTIRADGELVMVDGTGDHIVRSNTNSTPVGPMIIYGRVELNDGSSSDISIAGITIKDGGLFEIGTGLGSTSTGAELNVGAVVIESGGAILNTTTSDVWFANASLAIQPGGVFRTNSSTTIFPATLTNNGKVRYERNPSTATTNQVVVDMDYVTVEFSFRGNDTKKIWTLTGNRAVTDSLTTNNSAELILGADTAYTVTVGGTLRMTSGLINNSDPDATLVLADGVLISRATGEIATAPQFDGVVNVRYTSSTTSVTTGPELPTGVSALNNLIISSPDQVVTLGADATANGVVALNNGTLSTGAFTLTLAESATLDETTGFIVQGNVTTTRGLAKSVYSDFGGIGLEISAEGNAPGETTVLRVTGTPLTLTGGGASIVRYFDISPAVNAGLDATMIFHYDDGELNGLDEASLVAYASSNGGASWVQYAGTLDDAANTMTITGLDGFSLWTLGAPVGAEKTIDIYPAPLMAIQAYAYGDPAKVWFNFQPGSGHTVADVNLATLTVNGINPAATPIIVPAREGFIGDIIEIPVGLHLLAGSYGLLWNQSVQNYTVAGEFGDATPFTVVGQVDFIGHTLGSVDGNQLLNLLDILYLIDRIYTGGPAPLGGDTVGDCDCSSDLNLLDVLILINHIYTGGPAPDCVH
jgi:hypothetical protein